MNCYIKIIALFIYNIYGENEKSAPDFEALFIVYFIIKIIELKLSKFVLLFH